MYVCTVFIFVSCEEKGCYRIVSDTADRTAGSAAVCNVGVYNFLFSATDELKLALRARIASGLSRYFLPAGVYLTDRNVSSQIIIG